jgi:hypothetical protein
MPRAEESAADDGLDLVARPCMFTGLCDLEIGNEAELELGDGFSLVEPNQYLLSARDRNSMTGTEFDEAACVSRYLVYRQRSARPGWTGSSPGAQTC